MDCKKCLKSDSEFYTSNKNICKECVKAQSAQWKKENQIRRGKWQVDYDWAKRGINDLERAREIKETIKSCAICGSDSNLQVDHCHETGTVRSMLCGKCNRGLGIFGDNLSLLKNAYEYIENHNTASISCGTCANSQGDCSFPKIRQASA